PRPWLPWSCAPCAAWSTLRGVPLDFVDAESPRAERYDHEHPADDGKILHEVDLIGHGLGTAHRPEVVDEDRCERGKNGQRERCPARLPPDEQQQAAAELDADRERSQYLCGREAFAGDVARGAGERHD